MWQLPPGRSEARRIQATNIELVGVEDYNSKPIRSPLPAPSPLRKGATKRPRGVPRVPMSRKQRLHGDLQRIHEQARSTYTDIDRTCEEIWELKATLTHQLTLRDRTQFKLARLQRLLTALQARRSEDQQPIKVSELPLRQVRPTLVTNWTDTLDDVLECKREEPELPSSVVAQIHRDNSRSYAGASEMAVRAPRISKQMNSFSTRLTEFEYVQRRPTQKPVPSLSMAEGVQEEIRRVEELLMRSMNQPARR